MKAGRKRKEIEEQKERRPDKTIRSQNDDQDSSQRQNVGTDTNNTYKIAITISKSIRNILTFPIIRTTLCIYGKRRQERTPTTNRTTMKPPGSGVISIKYKTVVKPGKYKISKIYQIYQKSLSKIYLSNIKLEWNQANLSFLQANFEINVFWGLSEVVPFMEKASDNNWIILKL